MARTCVIDISSGLVTNIVDLGVQPPTPTLVEHTEPPEGFLFVPSDTARLGAHYADGIFTAPVPEPGPVALPVPPSPRAWLERLSPQKQAAISAAALGNAAILLWVIKASGSTSIDVTLQETKDGVAALVAAGVFTADDQALLLAP